MQNDLIIRRATDDDWPGIWAILSAVITGADSYMLAPDTPERDAHAYWVERAHATYVAERDGAIVGSYAIRANQPGLGAHVANAGYMVRADMAGRGIAGAMCEHSLREARDAGFLAMQFNAVVSTNVRAVALWQRMGFAIVGTVPGAFRHRDHGYVDIHIMHRML